MDSKKCLENYKQLFLSNSVYDFEVGTTKSLQQIHKYIFNNIYDFAGCIRTEKILKGNFWYVNPLYLEDVLKNIEKMPESNLENIIQKYIEMNIAHPFKDGNGISTRIWLDLILKKNLNKIVSWKNIDKNLYFQAMERSPVNSLEITTLIQNNLTDDVSLENYLSNAEYSLLFKIP